MNKVNSDYVNCLEGLRINYNLDVAKSISQDALSCIPVIGQYLSNAATLSSDIEIIRETHLVNVTITFLQSLDDGTPNLEKCRQVLNEINSTDEMAEAEELRIMALLNNIIDKRKATLLGKLVNAVAKGLISKQDYRNYTELLDKLLYSDLEAIMKEWGNLTNDGILYLSADQKEFERLANFGIGERVSYQTSEENEQVDFTKVAFYLYDEFSQRFLNVLCDKPSSPIYINKSAFLSYHDVPAYNIHILSTSDVDTICDDILFNDKKSKNK